MAARILLAGDVMLGRLVGKAIGKKGSSWPLGSLEPVFHGADAILFNLECAITSSKKIWNGPPKAFYFGAPESAVQALIACEFTAASLANNHLLDFGYRGMLDTLQLLDDAGILHAGAGRNASEAAKPAFFERKGISFGLISCCDHQQDFSAGEDSPGIRFLDLSDEKTALEKLREDFGMVSGCDWPILSLHWGPNLVDHPSEGFRRIARSAIDMGFRLIHGHSAHVFHGVEMYRGSPIFYSCGDLVDDYLVDPHFRNDHQLIFDLSLERKGMKSLSFHPVLIECCRASPATGKSRVWIAREMARRCEELGTRVSEDLRILPPGSDCDRQPFLLPQAEGIETGHFQ
ncbi:MAG: CapA family protein [Burkholderiales bacterium]|nr:CapA family protein [Burkholderiales bacterium]